MTRAALLALTLAWLAACGDDFTRPPDAFGPSVDAWPCALEAPRCRDADTLTTCDLERATEVDVSCLAAGGLCGVGADGRAACVAQGEPCGDADRASACTGPVLQVCDLSTDARIVTDCRDHYGTCGEDPWYGHACVSTCTALDVTAGGACDTAGAVVRCAFADGVYQVVNEPCTASAPCRANETGGVSCTPRDLCEAGRTGRCAGEVALRCDGATLITDDCALAGEVCTHGPDGAVCAPPGVVGAYAARGTVRYEDRVPSASGLGPRTPRAARAVAVAVIVEGTDEVLASAATADDGSFVLRFDAPPGTSVRVLAATSTAGPVPRVRVVRPDGFVHGLASAAAVAGDVTFELLATDASGLAPAFNALDVLLAGLELAEEAFGATDPGVDAVYARGSEAGTYYDGRLHVLGEPVDDDGHDDTVLVHELGHHIEAIHSSSDSPGGPHDGSPGDPRLMWSEGFATWFAVATVGTTVYVDTNAFGGFTIDVEGTVTHAEAVGGLAQQVSEDLVSEVLQDLADDGAPDDDPAAGPGPVELLGVLGRWLRADHEDRGATGVELVDALDGWRVHLGDVGCAAIRAVVIDARAFPYDRCP